MRSTSICKHSRATHCGSLVWIYGLENEIGCRHHLLLHIGDHLLLQLSPEPAATGTSVVFYKEKVDLLYMFLNFKPNVLSTYGMSRKVPGHLFICLLPVFRIRDIVVPYRSESLDPYTWLRNGTCSFCQWQWLSRCQQKICFFLICFAHYFLYVFICLQR